MKGTTMDIASLIRDAKLPEKTVPICLRPDLAMQYEELADSLVEAKKVGAGSLAGNPEVPALSAQMETLKEQMKDSTAVFTLRALPRSRFRNLANEHPPRKDAEGNILDVDRAGVSDATFPEALVRECLVAPELNEELWTMLTEKLTDRQFQELVDAAWSLNRSEIDVPFSPADLLRATASALNWKPPSASASPIGVS
jgi:hypothetical protein